MKQLAAIAAIVAIVAGCAQKPITEQLEKAAQQGKYLYGHQDDLMYGHTWNATKENDHELSRSDVLSTAGAYPAVLGLDLGGIECGEDSPYGVNTNLDGNNFDIQREAAVKHYERGGIVTLSWHPRNPVTGGDAWDVSCDTVVEQILPGGSHNELFTLWLDNLGDYIASLKDKSGRTIPVIFRPWHEHTGGWFWWGTGLCTPEQYNALWVYTYKYLVEEKGLVDMVWAISPNSTSSEFEAWEERYPGDEYVDLIGLDCYQFKSPEEDFESCNARYIGDMRRCLAALQRMCEEHGKILAVTETGFEGLPYANWWTEVLQPAIDGFPISYVLTWRNTDEPGRHDVHYYAPWPGNEGEGNFRAFAEDAKTVFLKK